MSVVVPTWNRAALLAEALASILAQTWRPLEALVVDDDSSDGTADVVAAATGSDVAVTLLRQDHRGAQAARNHGLAASHGDLVLFLDSDDLLAPDAVAAAARALADPSVDAVYGDWREGSDLATARANAMGPVADMVEALLRRCWCPPFAYLWRRMALGRDPWDETVATNQDFDLVLRRAVAGCRFRHLPQPMGLYRRHDQPRTSLLPARVWARETTRILARAETLMAAADNLTPARRAALAEYHWVIAKTVRLSEPETAAQAVAEARRLAPAFRPARRHERCLAAVLGLVGAARVLALVRAPRRVRPA